MTGSLYFLLKGKQTIVVLTPGIGNQWTLERYQVKPPKRMTDPRTVYSEPGYELPDSLAAVSTQISYGAARPVIDEVLKQERDMETRRANCSWKVRGETHPRDRKGERKHG